MQERLRALKPPDNHEYRITPWPNARLPHPAELLRWRYELRNEVVLLPEAEQTEDDVVVVAVETAGEIYLKLRALNLNDQAAVLRFANEYGVLGIRANDFAAVRGVSGANPLIPRLKAQATQTREKYPATILDSVDAWKTASPLAETLLEFRFAAGWLHDLTNLWLIASGRSAAHGLGNWHVLRPDMLSGGVEGAADWLEHTLTPALRPFHPRVMIRDPKDYKGLPITPESAAAAAFAGTPLFAVCALELFNHIVEDAEFKTCGNQACGRLFVRQEGRSRVGQHRTSGVSFCSERCLRAQKQREYRERERTKLAQRPGSGADEPRQED